MSLEKEEKTNTDLTEVPALTLEEEVVQMASCGLTLSEMASYLCISKKQFKAQAETPDSKIYNAILKGKLMTEIAITSQQKVLAESGNITAVQVFEKRMESKETQELKERLFYVD